MSICIKAFIYNPEELAVETHKELKAWLFFVWTGNEPGCLALNNEVLREVGALQPAAKTLHTGQALSFVWVQCSYVQAVECNIKH